MAVVYADNTIEIAVIQSYSGRPAVNVWHVEATDEWFPAESEEIVRDFANNWQDHMLDLQTSSLSLLRFEWRSLDASDGTVGVLQPDPAKPITGQQSGSGAPPNVATLVKKNTTNRPRGARDGRAFIVGTEETVITPAGVIAPASVTAWQNAVDDFYDGISDTGFFTNNGRFPVVLETTAASRAPGQQPVTVNTRRITSLTVDSLVSTQRDRLR